MKQEQILGKYDALTDDYCVFARESFRRHFTEMVADQFPGAVAAVQAAHGQAFVSVGKDSAM